MNFYRRVVRRDQDHVDRLIREQVAYAAVSTARSAVGAILVTGSLAATFHWLDLVGPVSAENALAVWATMGMWSLLCLIAVRTYRSQAPEQRDIRAWHNVFKALFAINGTVWGVAIFLLWVPGNTINHFALLMLCIVNVGNAVNEHGENFWFVGAVSIAVTALTTLCFIVHPSPVGTLAAVLLPIALGWYGYMALHARRRFAELVLTRLQNEDLAKRASASRDEALTMMAKVESASNAKTVFLANMSHELRTPLNAIIGFSQIVRDELFGPLGNDKYKDYLGDIERSGQHLLSIINDILDIAKLEAGKIEVKTEWVEPAVFLEDAVRLAGGHPNAEGIEIRTEYAHGNIMVLSDARMMRQAVLNLVSNAVKHSPRGETVTVASRMIAGGGLRIEIADHGVGIPAHLIDRVFEAFEQADNSYAREKQGTGLGLALVRAFVAAHGGKVWLESQEGSGTTAFIELPRTRPGVVKQLAA